MIVTDKIYSINKELLIGLIVIFFPLLRLHLIACEIDPKAAEFAQDHFSNSEHGSKIDIRLGSALDTLKILLDENRVFDLVFIDADKIGYKNYFQYHPDLSQLFKTYVVD